MGGRRSESQHPRRHRRGEIPGFVLKLIDEGQQRKRMLKDQESSDSGAETIDPQSKKVNFYAESE